MRKPIVLLFVALALTVSLVPARASRATTFEVRVTNLTRGQILSPPVVVAHGAGMRLFRLGRKASPELAAVAEDADTSALEGVLASSAEVTEFVVGDGPVLPGQSASFTLDAAAGDRLSVVSMLVTTNDAFAGLNGYDLDSVAGRTRLAVAAYDAGSERNSEDCSFIPGPPCGSGGVRNLNGREGFVHVHSGIHGGGDLDVATHDWRNPVALIEIIPR